MRRFESHYQLTDKDRGDADTFNKRLKDLDERLNAQEELRTEIEALQQTLLRQAATRMDEVLLPALERIREIQSGGFLVAHIAEGTAVALVEGNVSIAVDQSMKSIFRPTPFVALVREDSADDWAVARALGYDEATGVLDLDVLVVAGQPGPFEDLIVSATGGGVAGQIAFLERTREQAGSIIGLAEAVSDDRDAVAADRLATANARTDVTTEVVAFGDAMTLGLHQMEQKALRAEDAAERAEQLDPSAFLSKAEASTTLYTRNETDTKFYTKVALDHATTGKMDKSAAAGFATAAQGVKADGSAQVYKGTNINELNFPIGHTVFAITDGVFAADRNATVLVGVTPGAEFNPVYLVVVDNVPAPSNRLTGQWRSRGAAGGVFILLERVL